MLFFSKENIGVILNINQPEASIYSLLRKVSDYSDNLILVQRKSELVLMFRNCIQIWIIKPFVTVKPVFGYYWDFVHVLTIYDQFYASFFYSQKV